MLISSQDIPFLPRDRCIGLTSGCFDLLHYYHLHYLERCSAECDFLLVGVDSDQLLTNFKAKAPCIPEHHRAAMVAALKPVDAVFIMRNLDQFQEMANCAHKIFKNAPELYGRKIVGGAGKLVVIPDVDEVQSTTAIVAKIRAMPYGA
jgi:cytidyltransferase-like protein